MWVRIDNRLIHGQVIETWLPYTRAKKLLVVNDAMAGDELQQQIASLAVPARITVSFIRVDELAELTHATAGLDDTLILFANCSDIRRTLEGGFMPESINVGNLHYAPGKKQLCAHVAVSEEDEVCLRYFGKQNIDVDFRCVPNEPIQVKW